MSTTLMPTRRSLQYTMSTRLDQLVATTRYVDGRLQNQENSYEKVPERIEYQRRASKKDLRDVQACDDQIVAHLSSRALGVLPSPMASDDEKRLQADKRMAQQPQAHLGTSGISETDNAQKAKEVVGPLSQSVRPTHEISDCSVLCASDSQDGRPESAGTAKMPIGLPVRSFRRKAGPDEFERDVQTDIHVNPIAALRVVLVHAAQEQAQSSSSPLGASDLRTAPAAGLLKSAGDGSVGQRAAGEIEAAAYDQVAERRGLAQDAAGERRLAHCRPHPVTAALASSSWTKEGTIVAEAEVSVKSHFRWSTAPADALEIHVIASPTPEVIQEQAREKRIVEAMSTRAIGAAAGFTAALRPALVDARAHVRAPAVARPDRARLPLRRLRARRALAEGADADAGLPHSKRRRVILQASTHRRSRADAAGARAVLDRGPPLHLRASIQVIDDMRPGQRRPASSSGSTMTTTGAS